MKLRWLFMLVPLSLIGCSGEEHSDIKQWMKDSTKDLRGHVQPLPRPLAGA